MYNMNGVVQDQWLVSYNIPNHVRCVSFCEMVIKDVCLIGNICPIGTTCCQPEGVAKNEYVCKQLNECADDTCQNGGYCYIDAQSTTKCDCPIGFSGTLCEIG